MTDVRTALRIGRLFLVIGAVLAAVATLGYGVNGDVRYELGTQWTSMQSPAETFTHRPLMHRLLMSWLAEPAEFLRRGINSYEMVLRAESIMIVAAASALLWAGLRRRWPDWALPVAVVAGAATLLMSPGITYEPDWLAVPITVAGIGAGLMGAPKSRAWPIIGGILLAVAAVTKVLTLPIAMIGLVVLWRVDRRRFWWVTGAAVAAGLAWIAVVAAILPHEFGWLLDSSTLQPSRVLAKRLEYGGELVGNAALMWPALILFPAALIHLGRRDGLLALLIMVLAWVPAAVQNQYFIYHAPAAPVIAAVAVLPALRSRLLQVLMVTLTVLSAVVLNLPAPWRVEHKLALFAAATAFAVIAAAAHGWQLRAERADPARPTIHPGLPVIAGALVVLATLPPILPSSAWAISLRQSSLTTQINHAETTAEYVAEADAVRQRIGPGSTVTYLTFGDRNYMLRNPTPCRFPTNVFLQRSRYAHAHEGTPTWQENLTCLTEADTDWLVWDTSWFSLTGQPEVVPAAIDEHFDCRQGFTEGALTVCPRRR